MLIVSPQWKCGESAPFNREAHTRLNRKRNAEKICKNVRRKCKHTLSSYYVNLISTLNARCRFWWVIRNVGIWPSEQKQNDVNLNWMFPIIHLFLSIVDIFILFFSISYFAFFLSLQLGCILIWFEFIFIRLFILHPRIYIYFSHIISISNKLAIHTMFLMWEPVCV